MKGEDYRVRASAAHALMQGDNRITDTQLAELEALIERDRLAQLGEAKPLTKKMHEKVAELTEKKNAPLQLGKTAQSMVKDAWRFHEHGYRRESHSDETIKGQLCEAEAVAMLNEVIPLSRPRHTFCVRKKDSDFTGECDVNLTDLKIRAIEDIKCPFDLKTYMDKEEAEEVYKTQGQVYMALYDADVFRLRYCLINTPEVLIKRMQFRMMYIFRDNMATGFEELLDYNPGFRAAVEQVAKNHNYDHIPAEQRIKSFEFERDDEYIKELRYRAKWARDFYDTIKL